MIIESIFCNLRDMVMETNLFRVGYEYVEMVQTNHANGSILIKPKYYDGKGTKDVQNFDVGGMFYIRKNGRTSMTVDTDALTVTPCPSDRIVDMTIPVKLVACVLRSTFDSPRFADDTLTEAIINKVQGKINVVDLGARSGTVRIGSTETDAYKIWGAENQGVAFKESDFARFAYVSVDFNIIIKADVSCLSTCLNEY